MIVVFESFVPRVLQSNNIHQQKFGAFPNPRIGYLCPRCKSLCNDTKACGHCGLPAAQNQETLQTLDADPTNVNPVNRTLITHSTLSPRTFYARKLQELSCSASITVNSMRIIQRRTPRRGVKRPVVDPPG